MTTLELPQTRRARAQRQLQAIERFKDDAIFKDTRSLVIHAVGGAAFGLAVGIAMWMQWGPRWLLWDLIWGQLN